jgi:ubiquinone/menaquinone biosynthesis C-methylase UbiE
METVMTRDLYTNGGYLEKNPRWHTDESPWKARYVLQLLARNAIKPRTVCDVGCGAGEVLRQVHDGLGRASSCVGYDISPQALAMCQKLSRADLTFKLGDIREETDAHFDLILLMDVFEHLENYFTFLREIRTKAEYKVIHIPLDISVRTVLWGRLSRFRAAYGHLHYFTKDVALEMLREVGYEVIDYVYTWQQNSLQYVWMENRRNPPKLLRRLAGLALRTMKALPSLALFAIDEDLAARIMGHWRLLVLAR